MTPHGIRFKCNHGQGEFGETRWREGLVNGFGDLGRLCDPQQDCTRDRSFLERKHVPGGEHQAQQGKPPQRPPGNRDFALP
jgi:hypothetical protein